MSRSGLLRFALSLLAGGAALLGSTGGTQAQDPTGRLPDPEVRQLMTSQDKFPIKITYYASNKGKESPVVILLHDKDGNRFIWQNGGFAEVLQKEGFAVATVDLRHHGESRMTAAGGAKPPTVQLKPVDYAAMVAQDLPAVKKFLLQQHHDEKLNINKLGIVGPGMGGAIAAYWAGNDWNQAPYPDAPNIANRTPRGQDVKAVILISPDDRVPGLPLAKAIGELRKPGYDIAFLLAYGKLNSTDKNVAATLFKQLTTFPDSEKRMYKQDYATKLSGTEMLGKGLDLEKHMLVLLHKHVRSGSGQWRNRKSPLEEGGVSSK